MKTLTTQQFPEKDIEAVIDELVLRFSRAQLKKMGGRSSLRKAAIQKLRVWKMQGLYP